MIYTSSSSFIIYFFPINLIPPLECTSEIILQTASRLSKQSLYILSIGHHDIMTAAMTTTSAIFAHTLPQYQSLQQNCNHDLNFKPCNQIYIIMFCSQIHSSLFYYPSLSFLWNVRLIKLRTIKIIYNIINTVNFT